MKNIITKSKEFWDKKSSLHGMRAVIDFNDELGYKNRYIDFLQKAALAKYLRFSEKQTVLDFGCGNGRLFVWLADRVKEVCGIDISEKMIAQAQNNISKNNIQALVYDGKHIPYEDGYFDLVISIGVIQGIVSDSDLNDIIQEIVRVMKKGSQFCIIERLSNYYKEENIPYELIQPRGPEYYPKIVAKYGLNCLHSAPIRIVPSGNRVVERLISLIYSGKIPLRIHPHIAKLNLAFNKWKGWSGVGYVDNLFVFRKKAVGERK